MIYSDLGADAVPENTVEKEIPKLWGIPVFPQKVGEPSIVKLAIMAAIPIGIFWALFKR